MIKQPLISDIEQELTRLEEIFRRNLSDEHLVDLVRVVAAILTLVHRINNGEHVD